MTTDEPPQAPKAAASAAIFQGETVLLVKRGKPPLVGALEPPWRPYRTWGARAHGRFARG